VVSEIANPQQDFLQYLESLSTLYLKIWSTSHFCNFTVCTTDASGRNALEVIPYDVLEIKVEIGAPPFDVDRQPVLSAVTVLP